METISVLLLMLAGFAINIIIAKRNKNELKNLIDIYASNISTLINIEKSWYNTVDLINLLGDNLKSNLSNSYDSIDSILKEAFTVSNNENDFRLNSEQEIIEKIEDIVFNLIDFNKIEINEDDESIIQDYIKSITRLFLIDQKLSAKIMNL